MKKHYLFPLFLIAIAPLTACTGNGDGDKNKLDVYASCYPIYDFVKQIGGEYVNAHLLPSAGLEPHEYEPTAKDMVKLYEGDLFFANGLGMEGWLDPILSDKKSSDKAKLQAKTIVLGNYLENKVQKVEGVIDPHAWLSTTCASIYLEQISETLAVKDPKNASFYQTNFNEAALKLAELEGDVEKELGALTNRKLVVSHAAFGYFANEFNFEQIYLSGLASEEPTVRDVERVINTIKDNNIHTIYAEELDGSEAMTRIQEETGAQVKLLYTLETLEKEDIEAGEDYYSIIRKNIATIKEGNK